MGHVQQASSYRLAYSVVYVDNGAWRDWRLHTGVTGQFAEAIQNFRQSIEVGSDHGVWFFDC